MSLMDQLTETVMAQISEQASQRTGLDNNLVKQMMPAAMGALMGGLKKNASTPQGADALASALDRHDGSILDSLGNLASDDSLADGKKILGHILGGKQTQAEAALAKTAGASQSQIADLMAMAAPAVLGALGKAKKQEGLDPSRLAGLVKEESQRVQQQAPKELGGLMNFLDQDGDGDFKDDLLEQAGKKLLGGLFGKK